MSLSRRTFLKVAAVAAVGLALPQTELITDAEEVARHYWALDKTHLGVGDTSALDNSWWRIGEMIGENRYMTSLRFDANTTLPSTLRTGDTIQLGELGKNGIYHGGLKRESYIIRHIDRTSGLVTVEVPAYHGKNTFSATLTFDDPITFGQHITPPLMESNRVSR